MQDIMQLQPVLTDLIDRLHALLPNHVKEILLFGSYARNEAEEGSDIDVLVLTDLPRDVIAQYNWKLGELAAALLMMHDIVVSPIIENQDYFSHHVNILPLYRNVRSEGVSISA